MRIGVKIMSKMDATALFKISYGLYVLTAREGDKDNGCIINTVQQITSSPATISISVNKQNYTHDMIMRTGKFNISLLSSEGKFEVFKHFGFQSGRDVDKFDGYGNANRSENGLYYIAKGTNSYISGEVIKTVDMDTHTVFFANITEMDVISGEESMTYDFYHKNVKPKPETPKKSGYCCKICGYVYEGEELPEDYECPLCKHGPEDFEKVTIE